MNHRQVLFLCTGNYYRSRFAEVFFNWQAEQRHLAWRAWSRGLALEPSNLGPMSPFTLERLRWHGIPTEPHLRRPLDTAVEDLACSQHVVAVKRDEHYPLLARRFPEWVERVEFWDVHDIDFAHPTDALPHLETQVLGLLARLESTAESKDSSHPSA